MVQAAKRRLPHDSVVGCLHAVASCLLDGTCGYSKWRQIGVVVPHQVMEAATVLLSPEVCLDPSLPPEQRAVADTPPLPEV